ncbi:MAG: alpha-2-macroglobulin family protein, partial [Bacteroidota bacterium]
QLNKEQKSLEIPILEEYRGNFAYHLMLVRENRNYQHSEVIYVPYSHKDLDISFETYRDKLQPGEKEEWKIKIKGPKGEKVAAEMMATLYDVSLDEFRSNYWGFNIYPSYYASMNWNAYTGFGTASGRLYQRNWNPYPKLEEVLFDELKWPGYSGEIYFRGGRGDYAFATSTAPSSPRMMEVAEEESMDEMELDADIADSSGDKALAKKEALPPSPPAESAAQKAVEAKGGLESATRKDLTKVKARTNFNETAFFMPHLRTNEQGEVIVKFTIPESLTTWKMLGLAHTKELEYGIIGNRLVTQKELMVVPNAPRYFREKDALVFSSKITNISDKDLEGEVQLFLVDALNAQAIDTEMKNDQARKTFQIAAGKSTSVEWRIQVPEGQQAITYKVVAKAGKFSDGEEMTLPVLSNRMLVTETLPLPIRGKDKKTFKMEKLIGSASSKTLKTQQLSLEFTSNPAWYAVQALPYLMEFPYECAEQVFSRYYANALASHIANSQPKIQEVFNTWKDLNPDALLSSLDKNQELKALMLEETPWVLAAQNEDARKHRLGLLFDLNQMANAQNKALEKLLDKQVANGAWTWFEGMPENRYLTQYIVTGMGHLKRLGVLEGVQNDKVNRMVEKAQQFLDQEMIRDYAELKRRAKKGLIKLEEQHIGNLQIQYFYARRYFDAPKPNKDLQEALDYYRGQAHKYWTSFNRFSQGMIALALVDDQLAATSQDIVQSLRERSLYSEELGMYWKQDYGYYWYQAPIETQAMMVEVFDEVAQDQKAVEDLKTWLLKQKQTQDWKTTRATAEACYALLLRGDDWLAEPGKVAIKIGEQEINPYAENNSLPVEAGTGYFKTSWKAEEVSPEMGKVSIQKEKVGVAWGALYWQYFEDLDKITTAETPLQLKKELFVERNTDSGQVIESINDNTLLQVGDKIKVRIELRVDRAMEYVHMKDMRAAGFEPINVISRYRYQD